MFTKGLYIKHIKPTKTKKKSEYILKHDLEMLNIPTFMYTCISYA